MNTSIRLVGEALRESVCFQLPALYVNKQANVINKFLSLSLVMLIHSSMDKKFFVIDPGERNVMLESILYEGSCNDEEFALGVLGPMYPDWFALLDESLRVYRS